MSDTRLPGLANLRPSKKLARVTSISLAASGRHLPAGEGPGTVAVEAVDFGAHVYADDVAVLDLVRAGEAVDDLVVDRDAGARGESAISEEGWDRARL